MKTLALVCSLLACGGALAATRYVDNSPNQTYAKEKGWNGTIYTTIEAALDGAGEPTDIYVAPGDYHMTGTLSNDKNHVSILAAEPDPALTRLIGQGSEDESVSDGLLLTGNGGGNKGMRLFGLTITNFVSRNNECVSVNAGQISNCVIQCCTAIGNYVLRTGVQQTSRLQMRDCRSENQCLWYAHVDSKTHMNCLVSNNTVVSSRTDIDISLVETHNNTSWGNCRFIDNRVTGVATKNTYALFGKHGKTSFDCLFLNNISENKDENETSVPSKLFGIANGTLSNCVVVACTTPVGSSFQQTIVSNCIGRVINVGEWGGPNSYNSLFVNNERTVNTSADYAMFHGSFYNCTFVGNRDSEGVYKAIVGTKTGYVKNCVFNGNEPADINKTSVNSIAKTLYGTKHTDLTDTDLTDCIQETSPAKIFNLGAKPELPYYALRRGSPAIDKGDATLNNNLTWEFDLAGNPRIYQPEGGNATPIDIGCYEWFPTNDGFVLILR